MVEHVTHLAAVYAEQGGKDLIVKMVALNCIKTLICVAFISDVNECSSRSNRCHRNAECQNNIGSYTCRCQTGYQGNGYSCSGSHITCVQALHKILYCVNLGNVTYLNIDIDECLRSNRCSRHATCHNVAGSYTCSCNTGYQGDGYSCTGIIIIMHRWITK